MLFLCENTCILYIIKLLTVNDMMNYRYEFVHVYVIHSSRFTTYAQLHVCILRILQLTTDKYSTRWSVKEKTELQLHSFTRLPMKNAVLTFNFNCRV